MEKKGVSQFSEILEEIYKNLSSETGDVVSEITKMIFFLNFDNFQVFVSKQKESFRAHRVVLVAHSGFLTDLFNGENSQSLKHIILEDYSSTVINIFISFCYTGQIQFDDNSIIDELINLSYDLGAENLHELVNGQRQQIIEAESSKIKSENVMEKTNMVFESNVETIFFEAEFENESIKEEYLNEAEFESKDMKFENQSTYQECEVVVAASLDRQEDSRNIDKEKRDQNRIQIIRTAIKKPMKPTLSIAQLKEEQERFKKRLQKAINSVKSGENSVKKVICIQSKLESYLYFIFVGLKNV